MGLRPPKDSGPPVGRKALPRTPAWRGAVHAVRRALLRAERSGGRAPPAVWDLRRLLARATARACLCERGLPAHRGRKRAGSHPLPGMGGFELTSCETYTKKSQPEAGATGGRPGSQAKGSEPSTPELREPVPPEASCRHRNAEWRPAEGVLVCQDCGAAVDPEDFFDYWSRTWV